MYSRILILSAVFFISACSGVHDAQTLATEGKWFDIGKQDGDKGMTSRSFKELQKLSKGNSIDFQQYEAGYKQGIDSFCNVNNAYSLGLAGIQYNGTCSHKEDGLRFNMEWQRGFQAYQNSL